VSHHEARERIDISLLRSLDELAVGRVQRSALLWTSLTFLHR